MRIAIAHTDTPTRQLIRQFLSIQADIQICWESATLEETIEQASQSCPDILLLDIKIPVNGDISTTVDHIMQNHPCPILLLTSSIHDQAGRVFEALGAGATDVAAVTPSEISLNTNDLEQLSHKLHTLRLLYTGRHTTSYKTGRQHGPRYIPLVAIGASTGGPAALATILSGLPANLEAAIVVIQHVDAEFSPGLAKWLNSQCPLNVRTARSNDSIECGNVYLAASEDHMVLTTAGKLAYTPEPADYVYRPSVDVFYNSLSEHWADSAMAILLTGMGRDGAAGMATLHKNNIMTIAQTETSCAVYGMPKAAIEAGAVDRVLDLDEISIAIKQFVQSCQPSQQATTVKLAR